MSADAPIVLEARGITRAFPGVQALAGVDLTLRAGEVHALMGQNGAGKSTLIKVLTGVHAPDGGTIKLLGQEISPHSPVHAQELGISAVHQESHLLPNLSVAENICAGRYPRRPWSRGGGIDWRETERRAAELLAGLGINLDVSQLAGPLPAALQQLATVARAVSTDARVLILDEPTSSLDADEVQALFALIRRLRDRGVARSEERRVGKERRYVVAVYLSSRRRHTRLTCDWSSDVCSSDLLDVSQLAGPLPAALQQLATVARAVSTDARVLILDEPTSSLDADEVQALFALIRRLRDRGVA